jgi:hypothetical protein
MIARRSEPRRGPAGIPPDEWRNPDYLAFLRGECRCFVCLLPNVALGRSAAYANLPCDPCHGPVNGASSKGPDREATPMCRFHHDEQTRIGWVAFEAKYQFDRAKEARSHWALFLIWREDLAE